MLKVTHQGQHGVDTLAACTQTDSPGGSAGDLDAVGRCAASMYQCRSNYQCVEGRQRCDGVAQCSDDTDELLCRTYELSRLRVVRYTLRYYIALFWPTL